MKKHIPIYSFLETLFVPKKTIVSRIFALSRKIQQFWEKGLLTDRSCTDTQQNNPQIKIDNAEFSLFLEKNYINDNI